ncbi:fumarylacetoacetate hydrolase family protein [Flavobacteriaceae bacterium F89]|uniref:Fumarylacetoacetate hydrolase family protein n=1 Tax=Cerina litoralis TaxID=2874477 RepID=A0AAE3JQY4_9FLAO|nr:fumarylacetoacetate hydrolase family protein [Cerina litoralis]MCG2460738.1 fumarylacetoacetate hydrolase family protein [Cerina litoralis]
MKIYKQPRRAIIENEGKYYELPVADWDAFINRDNLYASVKSELPSAKSVSDEVLKQGVQVPMGSQEIWAAGVTYQRSKEARMEEAKDSGGHVFYDKVYDADRPELFFKATAQRTVGDGDVVYIRRDSNWNVPEPELTLFINSKGSIQGYTIGNDMSSRDIEGENPLYLPQAKVYERCAAMGPCLYLQEDPLSPETVISIEISRNGTYMFKEEVAIKMMKRSHTELVGYLFRECDFPTGVFLMTGTCLVPSDDFTLLEGDEVRISIDSIGTLINRVAKSK